MSAALPFIERELAGLTPGTALDVACGRGRHLALLGRLGWRAVGVDRDADRLVDAARVAPSAELVCADIEAAPEALPPGLFDVVLTTFFLYRPLVPHIARRVVPGGLWLLETFHVDNHLRRGHPRRAAFCLGPGEAAELARESGLEVVSLDEGERGDVFTARLVARRPG